MRALEAPAAIPDRYELKYVVPEETIPLVRASLAPYCARDAHSAAAASGQYVITSLYFDTPARDLFRVSRAEKPVRFKVRVRRYGADDASGEVFLEVKHKAFGLVRKTRARVPHAGWQERVGGPPASDAGAAERAFRFAVDRHGLGPMLLQRYEREAWMSLVDEYARVTFDRRILCQPAPGLSLAADPTAWLALDHARAMKTVGTGVLLELKCTRDVPRWMAGLVHRFGLRRTGYSKYCGGVERVFGLDALPRSLALTPRFSPTETWAP